MPGAHGRGSVASRSTKTLEAAGSRHGRARLHPTEPSVGPARRAGGRRVAARAGSAGGGSGAAAVPFARHRAGFTRDFEDVAAFLATKTDKTTIARFLRIDWDTVGRICQRV